MDERRLNLRVYLLRTESSKLHSMVKIDFIFLHGNFLYISEFYPLNIRDISYCTDMIRYTHFICKEGTLNRMEEWLLYPLYLCTIYREILVCVVGWIWWAGPYCSGGVAAGGGWGGRFQALMIWDVIYIFQLGTHYHVCEFEDVWLVLLKYGVRSLNYIWAPVYSCTHWLRPRNSPLFPAFGLIYEGAIGQPRLTTYLCNSLSLKLCEI
jgi:hypothetical protein